MENQLGKTQSNGKKVKYVNRIIVPNSIFTLSNCSVQFWFDIIKLVICSETDRVDVCICYPPFFSPVHFFHNLTFSHRQYRIARLIKVAAHIKLLKCKPQNANVIARTKLAFRIHLYTQSPERCDQLHQWTGWVFPFFVFMCIHFCVTPCKASKSNVGNFIKNDWLCVPERGNIKIRTQWV